MHLCAVKNTGENFAVELSSVLRHHCSFKPKILNHDSGMSSIKYRINHNPVTYDHRTRTYRVGENAFESYRDAKSKQWQCEKCGRAFASFKQLRSHKNNNHSY